MDAVKVLGTDFANNFETVEKQEENRLRQILKDNVFDFDTWLELAKHIESYVIIIQKTREMNEEIYKEILEEYPLCYGYWRKLADIYAVQGLEDKTIQTYEESLKYLPVCVELWAAYTSWKASKRPEDEARRYFLFRLFERAVEAAGKSFKSSMIWDKYIEFEKSKKKFENVGSLYFRILQIPNERLHDYYSRFKLFMEAKGRKMEHYGATLPPHPDKSTLNIDPNDPCNLYPVYETKVEMHYSALCEVNRQNRLKEIIKTYETTLKEYNKRRTFEQNIKRTFFHAKSLDESQLEVWRKYLEYEENEGNHERIVLLYERCIVPLCYYAEFWERYASYIFKVYGEHAAREIYQRGIMLFTRRRPDLYLAQGHFEETLGKLDEARNFYKKVYIEIVPGSFDGIFRHLNLERRSGNSELVEELYKLAFKISYESGQDTLIMFVSAHYGKYQLYVKNEPMKMIEIYEKALNEITSKKSLYLAYIQALNLVRDRDLALENTRKTYEKAISEKSEVIFIYKAI